MATERDWFAEQDPPPSVARPRTPPTAPAPHQGSSAASLPRPPAAPATGPAPAAPGAPSAVSDEAVQAILEKYPATNEGMRAAMVEIDRTFGPGTIKLLEHPQRLDKLVMPDGRTIDAMVGAGAPGARWGWMVEGGGHGGTGGTLGGIGQGSLLGDPMAGRSITDDPSFQFRLGEGLKSLERSAAAKGTLLTGGFMKEMQRYAQDVASTEYGASYARRAAEQGNNFNRLYNVAGMGQNAVNASQGYASGYAGNIGSAQIGQGFNNANATATIGDTNAATLGTLGNVATGLGQKWYDAYKARQAARPANVYPGTNIPVGVGI